MSSGAVDTEGDEPRQTPHVLVPEVAEMLGYRPSIEVYLKHESAQQGLSIKSRVAHAMVLEARRRQQQIVESSSGNLALGLAYWCRRFGLPKPLCLIDDCCDALMADRLRDAGAVVQVVSLTEEEVRKQLGVFRRVEQARIYQSEGYYWPNQYDNGAWVTVHRETTGPEIWGDPIQFDLVGCAVGTGATVSGVVEARPSDHHGRVVAVEPLGSVIFGGDPGYYVTAGAGNPFVPANYRVSDRVEQRKVSDADVLAATHVLRRASVPIGTSGAMTVVGSLRAVTAGESRLLAVIADDGWYETV
jgi:N-(2-amino-2-carboxyethyl)-L-glutamate synthase